VSSSGAGGATVPLALPNPNGPTSDTPFGPGDTEVPLLAIEGGSGGDGDPGKLQITGPLAYMNGGDFDIEVRSRLPTYLAYLSTALVQGDPVTELDIYSEEPLAVAIAAGSTITLRQADTAQTFVTSALAAEGATTIPVVEQNALYNFAILGASEIGYGGIQLLRFFTVGEDPRVPGGSGDSVDFTTAYGYGFTCSATDDAGNQRGDGGENAWLFTNTIGSLIGTTGGAPILAVSALINGGNGVAGVGYDIDTYPRAGMLANGTLFLSDGTDAPDVNITREAAGQAVLSGALGMFGTIPPAAKPATPVTLANVILLLQQYGLCS
jgi:hypothetical protein